MRRTGVALQVLAMAQPQLHVPHDHGRCAINTAATVGARAQTHFELVPRRQDCRTSPWLVALLVGLVVVAVLEAQLELAVN
eukprot:COSAG03_NODE_1957_length_3301_cov_12.017489_5_plen_81_part_00